MYVRPDVVGVDFETRAIGPRPHEYPPVPVGVSVYSPSGKVKMYLSWGHPGANNSTLEKACRVLKDIYQRQAVVFHHAAFDLEVGERWLGLKPPAEWHDTMLLAYLDDPRQGSLSLKPLAHKMLGVEPSEQDRLYRWIVDNVKGASWKNAGAFISEAPMALVAPYAIGDTTRTVRLFYKLHRGVTYDRGMAAAYDRERKLVPVLTKMQQRGILIDTRRLEPAVLEWARRARQLEARIVAKLGGRRKLGPGFKLSSHQQLADALEQAELVEELPLTPKGSKSTSREVLKSCLLDKRLFAQLAERSVLLKYISTYGLPWLEKSIKGYVYPRINQVHGYHDSSRGGGGGTRTGRLSYSEPSLQNIPAPDRRLFPTLPNLRDFIIAEPGCVLNVRDYSQQEFRILAHYEDGILLRAYQADPHLDMHEHAKGLITAIIHKDIKRRSVKDTGFGLIYGMGLKKMARKMEQPLEVAKEIRDAYMKAIPGLASLKRGIEDRCRRGEPIKTWGGREYYVEPPKVVDGDLRTFDYKMINVLIQGSAGDCTKEAMIRADAAGVRLALQVHDELVAQSLKNRQEKDMALLREAMEGVPFDVKMLSDGKYGTRWGTLRDAKEN